MYFACRQGIERIAMTVSLPAANAWDRGRDEEGWMTLSCCETMSTGKIPRRLYRGQVAKIVVMIHDSVLYMYRAAIYIN